MPGPQAPLFPAGAPHVPPPAVPAPAAEHVAAVPVAAPAKVDDAAAILVHPAQEEVSLVGTYIRRGTAHAPQEEIRLQSGKYKR